jgi:hypothetical protein
MKKRVKSLTGASIVTVVAVLLTASLLMAAKANTRQSRTCAMDPIQQSICIYQAILADVDKTYRARGGGGISLIKQTSSTTFTVHIAQEGRTDLLNYTVKIGSAGKVEIVDRTEGTESY